jgi:putative ABC transport system permease protein
MIKNYFKITWRNIIRNRTHSIINISGLAIGIAASLILFTVVKYELSYDKFQPNYKRIYHVATERKSSEGLEYGEGVPYPAYDALRLAFPQVVTSAIYWNDGAQVTVIDPENSNAISNKKFIEEAGVFFSDPQFFSVFEYKWLAGSAAGLKDPDMAVVTKEVAERYFGKWQSAIGGLLILNNTATVKITGVLDKMPANTDFRLAIIASYETLKKYPVAYNYRTSWGSVSSDFQAFMLLPPGVSFKTVNQQLIDFSNKNINTKPANDEKKFLFLRPLGSMHFDTRFSNFGDHVITKATLWTLSLIGLFIIIMACINFINLSTAQAVNRSKEIGIKKVLGSNKRQLFWQMMGETAIIVTASIVFAVVIVSLCLPYVKHIASITEKLNLLSASSVLFIALIGIGVTVMAGIYPSLILSGFKPILAIKNKITSASVGSISLRRGLVVTQFAISQTLIIGTVVAISQMNFVHTADLGFNKDAILVLNSKVDSSVNLKQPAFKQELLTVQGVKSVAFSSDVPSSENNNSSNFSYDHRPDEKFDVFRKFADEDYFKTYGLEIIAGRSYDKSDTSREIVVNETLVKKLGIKNPDDVIGHEIRIGRVNGRDIWCRITGVVKDFKMNSLREAIKPLVLVERNTSYRYTGIKLATGQLQQTLAGIEKKWSKFFPEFLYTPSFMDERISNFYKQENQLALLYKLFAGIAIFISCLGLYGLISFMVVQKTKEVGIRKVLGASVANVVYLFSKEFTLLIIIAFALAAPVAYYMMSEWLKNFAFRIEMGVFVFLIAIVASIAIAWITVGYKSIKAAIANPIKSLRSE